MGIIDLVEEYEEQVVEEIKQEEEEDIGEEDVKSKDFEHFAVVQPAINEIDDTKDEPVEPNSTLDMIMNIFDHFDLSKIMGSSKAGTLEEEEKPSKKDDPETTTILDGFVIDSVVTTTNPPIIQTEKSESGEIVHVVLPMGWSPDNSNSQESEEIQESTTTIKPKRLTTIKPKKTTTIKPKPTTTFKPKETTTVKVIKTTTPALEEEIPEEEVELENE